MSETIKSVLDAGDINRLGDAARAVKLGTMLTPLKTVVTQAAAATITLSPPALGPHAVGVRVTAGAAAAGPRNVTDAGGAVSATVATLSDDGKTLTFEGNVTDAVVTYMPRPSTDTASSLTTAPGV